MNPVPSARGQPWSLLHYEIPQSSVDPSPGDAIAPLRPNVIIGDSNCAAAPGAVPRGLISLRVAVVVDPGPPARGQPWSLRHDEILRSSVDPSPSDAIAPLRPSVIVGDSNCAADPGAVPRGH